MLCFSEPYQPHAWPVAYQRTQTDKIIGIAAFDTNLAVATAGVPVVYSGIDPAGMSPTRHEKPFPVHVARLGGVGGRCGAVLHVDRPGAPGSVRRADDDRSAVHAAAVA